MPQHVLPHNLRVWLVHDWLTGMRGGEKVLLELIRMFPQARVATLFHVAGSTHAEIDARVARTSFLQDVPGIARHYRNLLPIMPAAVRSLVLDDCDLVVSTSHCVAKGVNVPRGVRHVCYCFTPMRYLWDLQDHYLMEAGFSLKETLARLATPALQDADLALNEGVTRFVTSSHYVADRIWRCYRRRADVVHPGFDHAFYAPACTPVQDFYLVVGALVPYKRTDLAVAAAMETGRKLVVIGKGPDEGRLRAMAAGHANVSFLGWAGDETIRRHYQQCRALLFPGEEDFGIVPLEVQGCGRPVIAYGAGGALETVNGLGADTPPTGVFFPRQEVASLVRAMRAFEAAEGAFTAEAARANAMRFTWAGFRDGMGEIVAAEVGRAAGAGR